MNTELYAHMHASATFLRNVGVASPDLAVVLGSGLSAVADILADPIRIPYDQIPHMPLSGAPGHAGELRFGTVGKSKVLMFCGRFHFYEGYAMWQTAYPVRILQALGCKRMLLTAAAGGLNPDLAPGDLVVLTDHINLMPDNPLRGFADEKLGDRFPDLSDVYDRKFAQQLRQSAAIAGIPLRDGVYAAVQGPSLETQSECSMLRTAGADVVGMSIVAEAIVGVQAGIPVACVCLVSNRAWHAGGEDRTTVDGVLRTAAESIPNFSAIISGSCSLF